MSFTQSIKLPPVIHSDDEKLSMPPASLDAKASAAIPEKKVAPPAIVDRDDIQSNGKLLDDKTIQQLQAQHLAVDHYHREKPALGLTGPDRVATNFPISIQEGALFADYRDTKHDKSVHLGQGATAVVKLAQNQLTGEWVATKIFKPINAMQAMQFRQIVESELKIMKDVGRARSGLIRRMSKKGVPKFQYYMELAPGKELFDLVAGNQLPRNSHQLLQIALNFMKELKKLIDAGYVHRDIKIENIKVDESGNVYILDLGFAIKMNKDHKASDGARCGSYDTAAPEILSGSSIYSEATDVYAAGVVLLAILFGQIIRPNPEKGPGKPFTITQQVREWDEINDQGGKKVLVEDGVGTYTIDFAIYELVNAMMSRDPAKRPPINKVIELLTKHLELASQAAPASVAPLSPPSAGSLTTDSDPSNDDDDEGPVFDLVTEELAPDEAEERVYQHRVAEVRQLQEQEQEQQESIPRVSKGPTLFASESAPVLKHMAPPARSWSSALIAPK